MGWLVRFSTSRIFALFLFAFRCLAADHQDDSFVLRDGFVFVNAIVNGHGPFRMLVDTGTTTTLLVPEAAAEAGLKFDHRIVLTSLGGEKPLLATSTGELQVGTGRATGVEIAVAAIGHVRRIDPGAQGILGQSFLSRSAYLIDYTRKKLWLGEDAIRRAEELPFIVSTQQTSGRTIVPVTLQAGGPSWNLTLDSGASNLILKCSTHCPLIMEPRSGDRVLALLGERPVVSGTLRRLEIAGARMWSVHAVLVDTNLPDGQDDGVIPSHWFSAVYVNGDAGVVRLAQRR